MCSPQHLHAAIYDRFIPPDFYDYGFTIVRNPFERLLSEYKWNAFRRHIAFPNFDEWVNSSLDTASKFPYFNDNHLRPQHEFVGAVEVFKFEDGLENALNRALYSLGLPACSKPLHHAKMSRKIVIGVARRTLENIVSFYKKDFDEFGYSINQLPIELILDE